MVSACRSLRFMIYEEDVYCILTQYRRKFLSPKKQKYPSWGTRESFVIVVFLFNHRNLVLKATKKWTMNIHLLMWGAVLGSMGERMLQSVKGSVWCLQKLTLKEGRVCQRTWPPLVTCSRQAPVWGVRSLHSNSTSAFTNCMTLAKD